MLFRSGGSGGALAIGVCDRLLMLQYSIYSVISPEGCASILWHSADKAQDAASAMKLTAQDLLQLKVIDAIIPEPVGGAHRGQLDVIDAAGDAIAGALAELDRMDGPALKRDRRDKFLSIGRMETAPARA